MVWAKSRPGGNKVNPKYRTREHVEAVRAHRAALNAAGSSICAEYRCVMRSRLIFPHMDLHLCHDRRTGQVLGLGHARCNRSEAARYARARQTTTAEPM